ncbi:MAG: peptidoglycan DD-metalloendopeptidase family protein [Alcaligenaceae bacterium]|nr:peptidoglycan DD-metalloendopeptidase family protein [Alcaligenaceae bacterium]
MRYAAFLLALLFASSGSWAAESALQQRQAEARRDQSALRERIGRLEKQIVGSESSRRDISVMLKKSETAISELDRQLDTLASDTGQAGQQLQDTQRRIGEQSAELSKRQEYLGDQLRAQYASGLSPWAALLSGEDPQDIARELGYLEYVARAQADALLAVRAALDELTALQKQAQAHEAELQRLAKETRQRRAELETQQAERQAVLKRIDAELKKQRSEARNLERNEAKLSELVDALAVAIEEEAAEQRRVREQQEAEKKRQAEAARRAEEARRQAQAQAESDAKAEEARKIAEARRAAEAIRAEQAAGQETGSVPPEPAPREAAPQSGRTAQQGLSKGLPYPVRGEVQGRFGMERPEGGVWRGIVLRAADGARVAAVAPGQVVYAGWLGGFGNLLIIDHGDKYLSVYAYNQSLLKQVGQNVRAGEAVATVGATGGQVEPGLYFEIRHEGKPVNPLLWLGKQ